MLMETESNTGAISVADVLNAAKHKEKTKQWQFDSFDTPESIFRAILYGSALCMVLLLAGIFVTLVIESFPAIKAFGLKFLLSKTWNPVTEEFGALPFLIGTVITSFMALGISLPFSLSLSVYLGEYAAEDFLSSMLRSAIELLAGIPSVIYGFWGLFIMVPVVRYIEIKLGVTPYGVGMLTSSLILAIMIIPYSASLGREVIRLVPTELKEAAYSLGATRFEVIRRVILPYVVSGITAGNILALGRAIGETMAVTMVIGNSNFIPRSIFAPANTMASVIANEFTEATSTLYLSSLVEIGLLLFMVTLVINIIGKQIIKKMSVQV
jgi:phosphate transport system permease protein